MIFIQGTFVYDCGTVPKSRKVHNHAQGYLYGESNIELKNQFNN